MKKREKISSKKAQRNYGKMRDGNIKTSMGDDAFDEARIAHIHTHDEEK